MNKFEYAVSECAFSGGAADGADCVGGRLVDT